MSLSDLERPKTTWHYDKWKRDLVFQPISARDLVDIQVDYADISGKDSTNRDAFEFYAELLHRTLIDPSHTKEEWLDQATAGTLIDLGRQAIRINGLGVEEAKKK